MTDSGVYINLRKPDRTTETRPETGDVSVPEPPPPKRTDPRSTTLTLRPKEAKSQKKKRKGATKKAFVSSAASKDTMQRGVTRRRIAIANEAHALPSSEI